MLYVVHLFTVRRFDILDMYAAGAAMDATNSKTKENTASLAVKSGNSALLQVRSQISDHPSPFDHRIAHHDDILLIVFSFFWIGGSQTSAASQ
jgi:hypothetical protein